MIVTGLALATQADEEGIAAPGVVRLAGISHCAVDVAHRRLLRLEENRFARRAGRLQGVRYRGNIRYELIYPAAGRRFLVNARMRWWLDLAAWVAIWAGIAAAFVFVLLLPAHDRACG